MFIETDCPTKCWCYPLKFTEHGLNTQNYNQYDTGIAACVDFNQIPI